MESPNKYDVTKILFDLGINALSLIVVGCSLLRRRDTSRSLSERSPSLQVRALGAHTREQDCKVTMEVTEDYVDGPSWVFVVTCARP